MNKSLRIVFLAAAVAAFGLSAVPALAAAASIDVWWPTDGAHISGTQPFKALVKDGSVDSYAMYWQVDGGQLNTMDTTMADYPHKEAAVDLSGWNWRSNGEYTINFVVKDQGGSTIAERHVKIALDPKPTSPPASAVEASDQPHDAEIDAETSTRTPVEQPVAQVADPTTQSTPTPTMSVWWPTPQAVLSGTQPFKARIEDAGLSEYLMYWQVDGGRLNPMYDSSTDGLHKEASVNVSVWTWKGSGPYEVTFVAKDRRGIELGRTTVPIYTGVPAPVSTTQDTQTSFSTPTSTPTPAVHIPDPAVMVPVLANPLSGLSFFVDPNNPAKIQASQWRDSRPDDAAEMDKIASQPGARWFGNWNGNIHDDVKSYVDAAAVQGQVPVMIAYNIPQRDCGNYSAGGVGSPEAYRSWIRSFADGIGNHTAVVVLEPDSLALTDCLSATDKEVRNSLIKDAVSVLKANGKTLVYLDAGHSNWVNAGEMANRLKAAGIAAADGFSLNVSNFEPTPNLLAYGSTISSLTGDKHFVVDTSRNGSGSNGQWCNPEGRAIGTPVTTSTGNNLADAFLWLKVPGESDGSCNGGPAAGVWWPEYALGLATRASY